MRLTEEGFLDDLISYSKVKQHEQQTSILHIQTPSVVDFAKGNQTAWKEIETLLNKRLAKIN